jgi:CheY-like chemotaxis protein
MDYQKTVLLAEDEDNDALLLKLAFEKAMISNPLAIVSNGRDAIEYLKGGAAYADRLKHPIPALMLLDLRMPVVNGFEVLSWRQKQPHLRRLPIIVLTSSNSEADVHKALSLGADGYCIKPAGLQYLIHVARELYARWLTPAQLPARALPPQLPNAHARRRNPLADAVAV